MYSRVEKRHLACLISKRLRVRFPSLRPHKQLYLEKWIFGIDNSVKTQCDVAAEKRRKTLGRKRRTDTFGHLTALCTVTCMVNPCREKAKPLY